MKVTYHANPTLPNCSSHPPRVFVQSHLLSADACSCVANGCLAYGSVQYLMKIEWGGLAVAFEDKARDELKIKYRHYGAKEQSKLEQITPGCTRESGIPAIVRTCCRALHYLVPSASLLVVPQFATQQFPLC
eukprot:SAG11_NODE_878_length_6760_cov_22.303558_5_plen_132_part_00